MAKRENFIDNKDRRVRMGRSIDEYTRNNGNDEFSGVVKGALVEENGSWRAITGSGYPRKGE